MATLRHAVRPWVAAGILALANSSGAAQTGDPPVPAPAPAPAVSGVEVNGSQATVRFQPHPAAQQYKIFSAPDHGLFIWSGD